jgi:hypothetical protein
VGVASVDAAMVAASSAVATVVSAVTDVCSASVAETLFVGAATSTVAGGTLFVIAAVLLVESDFETSDGAALVATGGNVDACMLRSAAVVAASFVLAVFGELAACVVCVVAERFVDVGGAAVCGVCARTDRDANKTQVNAQQNAKLVGMLPRPSMFPTPYKVLQREKLKALTARSSTRLWFQNPVRLASAKTTRKRCVKCRIRD